MSYGGYPPNAGYPPGPGGYPPPGAGYPPMPGYPPSKFQSACIHVVLLDQIFVIL